MKKIGYVLFIAVFFALCLIPSVGLLVKGPAAPAANEVTVVLPSVKKFDGTWNTAYFSELRDYVGKGFYLRLEGITGWDTLAAKLFHTSENDDVLLGPDGWLFFGGAANDISGAGQMSDREIRCAARSLALMQEYAESMGAKLVFTVPCGKYTLYPDHAPDLVTVAESSNRERLADAMAAEGVCYADLYEAFTAVDEELYWQWDSHWNAKGAALAADTLLASLGRDGGYFDGGFTAELVHSGDLYAMLFPTGGALEEDYTPVTPLSFEHTSSFHSYDDMTITTQSGGDGSLLMFRDSSGRNLYPYLADAFGAAYFSRMNSYNLTLIGETQADAVVIELAERTLNYLLKYPAVYPAPVRDRAVLDGAAATESELSADTSGMTLAGYAKLTGSLPETAVDARVYIEADGDVYEAIPNEGSFTAYIPLDADLANAQVYVTE